MSAARPAQIRAVHALKARSGLSEAAYRGMLAAYGVASSKDLDPDDADRLIARLSALVAGPSGAAPIRAATGPYAKKLQALWIALYNLGEVADRGDGALHAFLERQTGLPHTRFLREADAARAAIEPLKAWLIRAGVAWPARSGDRAADRLAAKRAVLRAQWLRLIALGAVRPFGDPQACDGLADYVSAKLRGGPRRLASLADPDLTAADLDRAAGHLGAWIRRASQAAEARRVG
ncbi:regulatory protein GemA [Methylobacterium sp. J-070]|uniref:regulatory protein GemA n=1 Tax=Methylobacterium sp. J-070 TaxID=2836650 RepID=UPI001FB8D6D2|nr:regulatory protein GemA [Methylobacterium sp. J-070]MCJ2050872.1 regulatory protein GemA [Methylobacterium sp. J-070]